MSLQRKTRGLSLRALSSVSTLTVSATVAYGGAIWRILASEFSQKHHGGKCSENSIIKWIHNMQRSMWTAYGPWHLVLNPNCFAEWESSAQRLFQLPSIHQNMDIWPVLLCVLFWDHFNKIIQKAKSYIMTVVPTNTVINKTFYKHQDCIRRLWLSTGNNTCFQ